MLCPVCHIGWRVSSPWLHHVRCSWCYLITLSTNYLLHHSETLSFPPLSLFPSELPDAAELFLLISRAYNMQFWTMQFHSCCSLRNNSSSSHWITLNGLWWGFLSFVSLGNITIEVLLFGAESIISCIEQFPFWGWSPLTTSLWSSSSSFNIPVIFL